MDIQPLCLVKYDMKKTFSGHRAIVLESLIPLPIRIANNIDFGKSWTYNLCALYSRCEIVQALDFKDLVDSFAIVKARFKLAEGLHSFLFYNLNFVITFLLGAYHAILAPGLQNVNSALFIHSKNSIAPPQQCYSEALPAKARSKIKNFKTIIECVI